MKNLIDNAKDESIKLGLKIGEPLSTEQKENLSKDIVWYELGEFSGEKVLIPKVYLSKKTLSTINGDSRTKIVGTNLVNIQSSELYNSGLIGSNETTFVKGNNIFNRTLTNQIGEIKGNKTTLVAAKDIENIGGKLLGKEELTLISKDGDILNSATTVEFNQNFGEVNRSEYSQIKNVGEISSEGKLDIVANNYTSIASKTNAKDLNIVAKEAVNISSQEVSGKQKFGKDGNNFVAYEFTKNIGSNVNAENINITAKNVDIKGSDVVAEKGLNISAKESINLIATNDSEYNEKQSKENKGFGRKKSSVDVSYTTKHTATNLIGDNVRLESGKDVVVLGSNIGSSENGEVSIKADGNIIQAGVKDTDYHYSKTSKTGIFGITSKSVTNENYAEKAILSATLSGDKGLVYDSKNNLLLTGVKVVSNGSINLNGKNIEINPLETKSFNKYEKIKKGFSSSFSPKGILLSYGKDKLKSNTDIVNQISSQVVSNKDINIGATDKVIVKSVDIYAKNDVNISGDNGIVISTATNSYNNTTKQSSSRIGASIGINSAIVNTVENVKNIKDLTNLSGNSYDILNNASQMVGAIKDGAVATNNLLNYKYFGTDSTGAETLKNNPNIFKANISYNKSESKSTVHNETVEKSSLVSGKNMNIKSKEGNIIISGSDIKVGKNLDLSATKDIVVKASEENFSSSNSSSQTGIGLSANISEGKIADLSVSKAGTKGRENGTNYVNSTINVEGKLKTDSENLTLAGANVEADKLNIKAKNLVIESKQDNSERKDKTYGGSFSLDLIKPFDFSANINGSKGNGEKEWVNKQSTLIAKNGGKVETDSLTNIAAVIGSESEKEKLEVLANKVVVKDLEDKNKYENKGGGITVGTNVPNISIKHDKVDKEQINRATAINTDITLNGEKVSAEGLGLNTDLSKSQEVTKDEERHLDAELHTDLLGEDKQNELKYAFKKLGSLYEILNQNKFKESMEGVLIDKFKDEHQKEFNLIKDENLSLEDKQKLAQNLVEKYLVENGYQGVIPEVLLTDEAHSFTVDSKDKTTGAKRREKIYFSINDISNPSLAFSQLFGHEKAHMNTYDEGKDGEETSFHTREKIGSENKNKVFSETEKADYLNNLRDKYQNQKSIEQQFAEAKLVPEKDKEYWAIGFSGNIALAFIGRVNFGATDFYVYNENSGDKYYVDTLDIGIGLGIPGVGATGSIVFF